MSLKSHSGPALDDIDDDNVKLKYCLNKVKLDNADVDSKGPMVQTRVNG